MPRQVQAQHSAMASSFEAAEVAVPIKMVAGMATETRSANSKCLSNGGCGDPMQAHCLATPNCSPSFVSDFGSSPSLETVKAAPPTGVAAAAVSRFLTDGPDRPPRQLA